MNHTEKLRQLCLKEGIANWRPIILEHAKQIVTERKLYDLSPSQVRALAAALEQVGDVHTRLNAVNTFFTKRKERRGEEKRWRKEVGGKTRLQAVQEEICSLQERAQTIVATADVPEEQKQEVEQGVWM